MYTTHLSREIRVIKFYFVFVCVIFMEASPNIFSLVFKPLISSFFAVYLDVRLTYPRCCNTTRTPYKRNFPSLFRRTTARSENSKREFLSLESAAASMRV